MGGRRRGQAGGGDARDRGDWGGRELGEGRRRGRAMERRLERGYQGFAEEPLGKAEGPRPGTQAGGS